MKQTTAYLFDAVFCVWYVTNIVPLSSVTSIML